MSLYKLPEGALADCLIWVGPLVNSRVLLANLQKVLFCDVLLPKFFLE